MAVHPGRWGIFRYVSWKRQLGWPRLVGLLVILVLCVVRTVDPQVLSTARARTFDYFQILKPQPKPATSPVAIVDLDEDSLASVGQWPWPRTIIAQMLDNLAKAGAIVVGFDVVFAEPDRMSPALVAKSIPGLDDDTRNRLGAMPSNDSAMAAAMQHIPVVLGMGGLDLPPRRTDNIPPVPTIAELGGNPIPLLDGFESVLRNTATIDNAAAGWGVFDTTPEPDGVVRRVPAVVTDGTAIYPALSIDMLRIATANQSLAIKMGPAGIQGVVVRPSLVPTDGNGRIWVYAAKHDPSIYIPAKDVVNGTFDPTRVRGKLVLVGTSAAGLQDIRHTAVEPNIPGVEVHAQIIDTVLFNQQLTNPPDAEGVEIVATIIGALLMVVLVPVVGARWTLLLFVVVAGAAGGFSWYEFSRNLTLYDPVFPATTTLITFILMTYTSYAAEEKQKKRVRAAFSRYMSPAQVEIVSGDPDKMKLGGERRDMTLLFCDVRGFTTISEMFDAEGLTKLINRFLSPMTEIILERHGTIDKYMGDCIMAFWNAPLDDNDHPRNACRSALAMNERLASLNDELEAESKVENRRHVPIKIGIGLNSGPAVVGNMGCDLRMDYSCLGDTVNTASRLEGQSKEYGVIIVIGKGTRDGAPEFATLELDDIQVKGKTEGVRIYTLLGGPDMAKTPDFQEMNRLQDLMLAAYRGQRWEDCERLLAECRAHGETWHLGGYYDLMDHRVEVYKEDPPGADWDGVYIAKTK